MPKSFKSFKFKSSDICPRLIFILLFVDIEIKYLTYLLTYLLIGLIADLQGS